MSPEKLKNYTKLQIDRDYQGYTIRLQKFIYKLERQLYKLFRQYNNMYLQYYKRSCW